MNKRKLGNDKEKAAAEYLERNGYVIKTMNFYCRSGEIDLIGQNEGYLCFIEVKYRADDKLGRPEEAVDIRKIRRISRAAVYYMNRYGFSEETPCRFDVAAIMGNKISIIKNAFEYCI